MNEVSIIINGTRYDAVDAVDKTDCCGECDLISDCEQTLTAFCCTWTGANNCFKVSDKQVEP